MPKKHFRPLLNIPVSKEEIFMDRMAFGIMTAMVLYCLIHFAKLSDTIPIHWNVKGEVDAYSSKFWLLIQPVLSVIVHFGLIKLCDYPHSFNYLNTLTQDNVKQEYIGGRKILRMVNVGCQVIFAFLMFFTIRAATGGSQDIGKWFIPSILFASFLPLVYAFFQSSGNESTT